MTSSVISFTYFTHSNISGTTVMQVFTNGKQHFHSSVEFYVINLKNQEVKI